MVEKGIVLGHKISIQGIEVDKGKVDTIGKLQYPTNMKGVKSFLRYAGFYRRFIKDFSKISKRLCKLLEKDSLFDFTNECKLSMHTLHPFTTLVGIESPTLFFTIVIPLFFGTY